MGELQDRIVKILIVGEGFSKKRNRQMLKIRGWMLDILEEAKKEFPKPLGDMINPLNECKKEPLYDTDKILEWFEKWFGKAHAEGK